MPKGIWLTRPERNWTTRQIEELESLLERGLSDEHIGRRLGRSANAVNIQRKRLGIPSRTAQLLSCRQVADRLGIGCSKSVTRWIEAGYVRGRRGPRRGPYRQWQVTEENLFEFLENPAHWHRWEARRITDKGLREWALELPKPRFLTLSEVARSYCVEPKTVHQWIAKGWLPARRNGNHVIDERDLVDFVPPCQKLPKRQSQIIQLRQPTTEFEERGLIVDLGEAS